jgi:hypothetical protein
MLLRQAGIGATLTFTAIHSDSISPLYVSMLNIPIKITNIFRSSTGRKLKVLTVLQCLGSDRLWNFHPIVLDICVCKYLEINYQWIYSD